MTRPLPWHDTPKCKAPGCGGPVVFDAEMGLHPCCGACGAFFHASSEEQQQVQRAEAAWELVLTGKVHEDRACARCGSALPIEQERLCPGCVTADMNERQGVLL